MGKRKLYLDIDDTVLDTENFIRMVLGGRWLDHKGLVYGEYRNMSSDELLKVYRVFNDYSSIPFIVGAEDGLRILATEYDIVFCSSYYTDVEKRSKEEWANSLGIPIILCKGFTKSNINMDEAVLVDNDTRNLNDSNASKKVCLYHKYSFDEFDGGDVVFNWFDLVDRLCPKRNDCLSDLGLRSILSRVGVN